MKGCRKYVLTQEAVDYVFGSVHTGFWDSERVKAVCDAVLAGASYREVGKQFGISYQRVGECVARVCRRYESYKIAVRRREWQEFMNYD